MYFIAISFLVSLTIYYKPRTSFYYLKFLPPFLLLTLAAESYGSYLSSIRKNNVILYNFFSTFEFCFYLLLISFIISNIRVRKIMWVVTFLYFVTTLLNILLVLKMRSFHITTYSIGCLLVVFFCIYYFFELFKLPKSGSLISNPAFWICTGLLFFYCCGFPLYGLMNSWSKISNLVIRNFEKIVSILNIILYTLFTIAFLCIRTKKYTLSQS